jgi:hypothetical protein
MKTFDYELLKNCLNYNKETGDFTWKTQISNRISVGDIAGSISLGYIVITLFGRKYPAHRLAWLYEFGVNPVNLIDHINRDKSDNRICNLRIANKTINAQNSISARKNSTSKILGAFPIKSSGKWRSRIVVDGKNIHLGCFKTPELANSAYMNAKIKYHTFS